MAVKKGIFFTVDSLLASGIVILAILLVSTFYINEHKKVNIGYASQDLVRVFSTMTIGEVNNEYAKSLIESGEITNLNSTIIEQIGDLWSQDKIDIAKNLTTNLTDQLIPSNYGFSVVIDGEEVYSRNTPVKKALVSSRKLVSGITKAQPTEGFTARVLLQGIKSKKTNSYVYFGGYEGDGNLTKKLILPNNVVSFDSAYLEVAAGGNFTLYINNSESGYYVKGSAGGGDMLADKWNLTGNDLKFFKPNENNITLNFTSSQSYIAGGFLKIGYTVSSLNGTEIPGYQKDYFPGIDGVINYYSSLYFPSTPNNISVYLHFLSPYKLFLNIGNKTIFQSEASTNEQMILINNSNISKTLDYTLLKEKTVPLRIGLMSLSSLGQGNGADAFLVTDRTSSMHTCDILTSNCASATCDTNPIGGCHDRRDLAAIKADNEFINTSLAASGNTVGSVGFGQSLYPYCDFHDLSTDNVSLINRVNSYSNAYCGTTCISCGIYSATQLLNERESLYGLNELFAINRTQITVGSGSAISSSLNIQFTPNNFDASKFIKSRLSIFGRRVIGLKHDCVYINNNEVGEMCDSASDWHTCAFPVKPEWLNTSGYNDITITGGDNNGCFGTGANNVWDFKDVKLTVWQTNNLIPSIYSNFTSIDLIVGNSNNVKSMDISINADEQKIKSAYLELEVANIANSAYNCIFVNGNYVYRIEEQRWDDTNLWQKVLFDVPVVYLKNGINEINFTRGSTQNCYTVGGFSYWQLRNVNLSVYYTDEVLPYDQYQAMVVMSDGLANVRLGDCNGCTAASETITKACKAHQLYNIGIYTVEFGGSPVGANTLSSTACCDNCSHFYYATDTESLIDAFAQIAKDVAKIGYQYQSINATKNLLRTHLYDDSYVDLNYTPLPQGFNSLPFGFETNRFGNNISSGNLIIYPNTSLADAKVTSYSGAKWTDRLYVNNTRVFNLSEYGDDYLLLGDPFYVNVPASTIAKGLYNITISTGLNDSNPTNGSPDNRIIYTLLLNTFTDYSPVVAKSDGCAWIVEFQDGTTSVIKVPPDYNGSDTCSYTSSLKKYSSNDSLEIGVFKLLSNLDIDKDGRLDVNIDESNLEVSTLKISKVPSLWGPAVIEINVWE